MSYNFDEIAGRVSAQATAARTFIGEKWDFADDKADAAFNNAIAAISNIAALGLPSITITPYAWQTVDVNIPVTAPTTDLSEVLDGLEIREPTTSLEGLNRDFSINVTKPDIPTITDFNWPDAVPEMGVLKPYPNITIPIDAYNTLNSSFVAAVRDKLAAGGTGLGATAEAALWARMRARNDAKNEEAYQEALTFWSSRGWDEPPGALASRLTLIRSEILRSETDLNNDITIEQARLAQANEQWLYELAFKTVSDYMRQSIETVSIENKGIIDTYLGRMEGYKAEISGEASRIDAVARSITALLGAYEAEIDGESAVIDAKSKANQAILGIYDSEVKYLSAVADAKSRFASSISSIYDSEVKLEATEVEAKARSIESNIRLQSAKADTVLKFTEIQAESTRFVWSTQVEVYKAVANIAAQLAASAMASVNASVSSSYGASSSENASGSVSDSYDVTKSIPTTSISYNHNYDEG